MVAIITFELLTLQTLRTKPGLDLVCREGR